MQLNPSEISELIKSKIEKLEASGQAEKADELRAILAELEVE